MLFSFKKSKNTLDERAHQQKKKEDVSFETCVFA
jgi:hypothetical protein